MNESGIYISGTHFQGLSPQAQAEILAFLRVGSPAPTAPASGIDAGRIGLDITSSQARKIIEEPLSRKTRAVLRAIAEIGPRFGYLQLAKTVGEKNIRPLSGVWAGITRRTRSVLGDRKAELFHWLEDTDVWEDDEYVDQQATVTEQTFHALREAFGLPR